ncbi:TRAP transporter small permease [Alkalibacter mobilis]|uniref:TRAP transporter small permease n=1 Tax=Alkalibacter mobilis TaxID=2787712 RepID=UPI00189E87E5|nr:TRAP transporter small permease subunit [Alkalibacter mobilis]MBF7095698.1 TRAP transporter small permease [Alkalibacter mobilis]
MKNETELKKFDNTISKILDFFEIHMSMLSFMVMFISFVILIFYRYVLKDSIGWLNELNAIAFVWSSIFAAAYGGRSGEHVSFEILYEKVSEKWQLIFRLIGSVMILVTFIILLPNAYQAVVDMAMKKSSVMKIPYNILYAPFILFVLLVIFHQAILFIKDLRMALSFIRKKDNS